MNSKVTSLTLKITQQEKVNDSLIDENFMLQSEIGRYEISQEIFKERNPSGAKQLEEIKNHETE